jgi:hypothetical protein
MVPAVLDQAAIRAIISSDGHCRKAITCAHVRQSETEGYQSLKRQYSCHSEDCCWPGSGIVHLTCIGYLL